MECQLSVWGLIFRNKRRHLKNRKGNSSLEERLGTSLHLLPLYDAYKIVFLQRSERWISLYDVSGELLCKCLHHAGENKPAAGAVSLICWTKQEADSLLLALILWWLYINSPQIEAVTESSAFTGQYFSETAFIWLNTSVSSFRSVALKPTSQQLILPRET